MTPKEQWKAFYDHKITTAELPDASGIEMMVETIGPQDRIPCYEKEGYDWFGVRWIMDGSMGIVCPDPKQTPILDDVADWEKVVKWPDLDKFDWAEAAKKDHMDQIDREHKLVFMPVFTGAFERLHYLMGYEGAMEAIFEDPESTEEFFIAFADWRCKLLEKIKQYYNPDVIWYHDDVGMQNNMFFSPNTWRELLKPQMTRVVSKAHELGMYFEYHSCGKIEAIVPELPDCGIDSWQGQEINDIAGLKRITGHKLCYHSMPDYQKVTAASYAGTMTDDDIRQMVDTNFLKNIEGGMYYPMAASFGDNGSSVMADEVNKLIKKYEIKPDETVETAG